MYMNKVLTMSFLSSKEKCKQIWSLLRQNLHYKFDCIIGSHHLIFFTLGSHAWLYLVIVLKFPMIVLTTLCESSSFPVTTLVTNMLFDNNQLTHDCWWWQHAFRECRPYEKPSMQPNGAGAKGGNNKTSKPKWAVYQGTMTFVTSIYATNMLWWIVNITEAIFLLFYAMNIDCSRKFKASFNFQTY
jgi:hypothetical protein